MREENQIRECERTAPADRAQNLYNLDAHFLAAWEAKIDSGVTLKRALRVHIA